MDKLGIARLAIQFVIGSSTSYCVKSVISAAAEPESTEDILKLTIGSVTLGALAASHANQYVDNVINEGVELWESRKAKRAAVVE